MPLRCRGPCVRRRDKRSGGKLPSWFKSVAQQLLQTSATKMAKTKAGKCSAAGQKVLAADGAADAEKGSRERRCNAGHFCHGNQERKAKAQILPHVAVFSQYQPLPPVAGV